MILFGRTWLFWDKQYLSDVRVIGQTTNIYCVCHRVVETVFSKWTMLAVLSACSGQAGERQFREESKVCRRASEMWNLALRDVNQCESDIDCELKGPSALCGPVAVSKGADLGPLAKAMYTERNACPRRKAMCTQAKSARCSGGRCEEALGWPERRDAGLTR